MRLDGRGYPSLLEFGDYSKAGNQYVTLPERLYINTLSPTNLAGVICHSLFIDGKYSHWGFSYGEIFTDEGW